MKRILGALMVFTVLIIGASRTTFASSKTQISFTVDGKVEKGEEITINVILNDVNNLYAASVDYIYNPEFLKVNSIESDALIKESNLNFMEPGGQTDKDGNRANYQMTFTGKVNGVSGSGTLVKIKAEVLKDFKIELDESNMKVKLVQVDKDYNVNRIDFAFMPLKTGDDGTIIKPYAGSESESDSNNSEHGNGTESLGGGYSNNELSNDDQSVNETENSEIDNENKTSNDSENNGEVKKYDKSVEIDSDKSNVENKEITKLNVSNRKMIIAVIILIGALATVIIKKYIKK